MPFYVSYAFVLKTLTPIFEYLERINNIFIRVFIAKPILTANIIYLPF